MRSYLAIFALSMTLLTGCTVVSENVDFDLASQPTIHIDNWVRRSPVQVYVYPSGDPAVPPKTLFVPFRMTQRMENATVIGTNVSRIVWQSWLQHEVLDTIEFANTNTPYRTDVALALARQRGADMVVGGYVTHILDGGTVSDTVVSISVEAYDVKTGNMIWSMAEGGTMPRSNTSDYLILATKSRMPTDPLAAVISTLGRDMGLKVREWAKGIPANTNNNSSKSKAFDVKSDVQAF